MNYNKHFILTIIIVLLMCGMASATTHTVCASGCDYTTIQAAVTAASEYDTVYVYNGSYTENVDISTANLTIEGEGADVVTVTVASSADHAFYVTVSHVNISGFNITNATDLGKAGIYLGYGANYCNISNNILTSNEYGIRLNSITGGNLIGNNASWNTYGIYLEVVEYTNLTSNIAKSNIYGIYAKSAYYTNLTSNIAKSNIYGIYLESTSNSNVLTNNMVNANIYGIYFDSSTNNALTDNDVLNILKTYSYLQTSTQEGTVGTKIDFNFTMKNVTNTDCSSCTYDLELSPSESNFQHSKNAAIVIGNFTPTRTGVYSLTINITDPNNNIENRKYIYLIDSTIGIVDYYFRDVLAIHGQPTSYGTDHDAGSLLFELPSSEEDVWCGGSVGFSVDVLPDNLFGIFKNINYSIWYQTGASGYTGIQRHGNVTISVDKSQSVSSTPKIFGTFSFMDMNWTNNYFWEWYHLSVKLKGSSPHIYSNQTHPSYANITYSYSTTPTIKSITNEDVRILSATSPAADDTEASIVLDGTGSTYLVVQMPNTTLTYTATWDGGACTGGDCLFTQSSGELNFTLTLGSEHTINISESDTASAWSIAGWDDHIELQINNAGGAALEYYQVYVDLSSYPINSTSLRVVNETAGSFVLHWQETITSNNCTALWFNATAIPASAWLNGTYYIYSGNDSANLDSNGAETFYEFLDKSSTSGWITSDLTVTTSTDFLRFNNPTGNLMGYAERFDWSTPSLFQVQMRLKNINLSYAWDAPSHRICDGTNANMFSWLIIPKSADQDSLFYYNSGWQEIGTNEWTEGTEHIMKTVINESDSSTGVDYYLYSTTRSLAASATNTPFSYGTAIDCDGIMIGDKGSTGEVCDTYIRWLFIAKYASPEPVARLNVTTPWTPMTISSPSPGVTETRYVSNRTVTYSATPSLAADCKWAYQNGTFIEWDNSTTSPSMVRWINSSSISAFNISLTAYETGNNSNHVEETWDNTIIDDVFDYTNYTWYRLSSWDRNFVGRIGNLAVGDVDNDGSDEIIAIGSQVDNDVLIHESDGSHRFYDSVTTQFIPFIFASVHDVDTDGMNELMMVGSQSGGWMADLFRFNTTAINASKKATRGSTKSNNPKDIYWINISDQEHFYTTGCGSGDTVDSFINFTTHSFNEIDDYSISGESTLALDIDGDGDLELIAIEGWATNAAKIWLYELNYDTGNYITKTMIFDNDLTNMQHYSAEVSHGDIDNDGIDNLIVVWRHLHTSPSFRMEAYEFDGITEFGEGNYSEGFFVDDLTNNSEIGWTDGYSHASMIVDIDRDNKNEFLIGAERSASSGSYLFRYDITAGGATIDRSTLVNFPSNYFGASQYFRSLIPTTIGWGDTKIVFALNDEQAASGTTEFFVMESRQTWNDITLAANKYGFLCEDPSIAHPFSIIAGEFAHEICFSWLNNSGECWESYWSGDSYNSDLSIPKHDAYFVLMDDTGETVSCGVRAADNVAIPTGWYATYLGESTAKTLTQIKTDMQLDGTVTNLYTWDHNAGGTGAWISVDVTPSHSVMPNQGILINNMGAGYNWDGTVS